MTSQISMRKLIKLELKQNSWMLALTALGHFLFGPVMFLLSYADYYHSEVSRVVNRYCAFFHDSYFIAQVMMMVLSISLMIYSYRYLFSKRMMDLYHSVPITRKKLFWVKYLHGFLVWLLPHVICGVLTLLLAFIRLNVDLTPAYAGQLLASFFSSMLLLLLCFFIFYHLFLTAAYLSGNVLNLFANVAVMGFSVIGIYGIFLVCAEHYFDTFCAQITESTYDILFSLSPFTTPFAIFGFLETTGFTTLAKDHGLLLILSILVSVALLFAAFNLCLKRPSELAERGTTNRYYIVPARIAATLLFSIAGAYFFGEIVSGSLGLAWAIFGALLCGILSYGALNSIFHATIKAFFKNKKQMAVLTAAGVLLITAFHLDWFGYDAYLPAKDKIAGAAIYVHSLTDDSASLIVEEDGSFKYDNSNDRVFQDNLLTDQEICYDFLEMVSDEGYQIVSGFSFYAKVKLTNGYTYTRRYRLNFEDYEKLAPFVESEDFKNANYKVSTGQLGYPNRIDVNIASSNISVKLEGDTLASFMDSYWQDFEDNYTLEEMSSYMAPATAEFYYENGNSSHYSYVHIPESYTRTLAYLSSLYPENYPYFTSAEKIDEINVHISTGSLNTNGGVRGYFGMAGYENYDEKTGKYLGETATVSSYGYPTVAFVEVAKNTNYQYATLQITDEEMLKELLPLLYFGDYVSPFDKREYIYFGEVKTAKGQYTACYVKPNTVPEEILVLLEESTIVE